MKLNLSAAKRALLSLSKDFLAEQTGLTPMAMYNMKVGKTKFENAKVSVLLKVAACEQEQPHDEMVDLEKATAILNSDSPYALANKHGVRNTTIISLKEKGVETAQLKTVLKLLAEPTINTIEVARLQELINSKIASADIAKKCGISVNMVESIRSLPIDDLTIKTAKILMQYFE